MRSECDSANSLMMKYMDGELGERDIARLRLHVADCPACKADFELYDFISESLTSDGGLTATPEGFTKSVMGLVAALPTPKRQAASAFDRLMCTVWGLFSMLFGLGFLLIINRERIIEYLSGIPALEGYIRLVEPIPGRLAEVFGNAADRTYHAFMTALGFVSEYRVVIFGALLALFALQIIMSRVSHKKRGES